jgi:hypothetical protein
LSTKRKYPARKNKPNVTSHPRLNLLSEFTKLFILDVFVQKHFFFVVGMTEEDPVETSNTSRPGNNVTVKSRGELSNLSRFGNYRKVREY